MQPIRYPYGTDPSQFADLYLPVGPVRGVAVVIHGGYWRAQYDASLNRPLAEDLAARGVAAWNVEYRRAGNGGGWPETFDDVAAGIDRLADAAAAHGLRLDSVVAVGHSAGGHLAVWAAGRNRLPEGAPGRIDSLGRNQAGLPAVPLAAVVSQSGVLDLVQARELRLSDDAVRNLLGASPEADPDRYALADPMDRLPLDVPVYAVQADGDTAVPGSVSAAYVRAAVAAGSRAELIAVPGGHMDLIDPATEAWAVCRDLVLASL
ncbi:MAG: alpha/beta hydrolase [Actinomycetales bacterium]